MHVEEYHHFNENNHVHAWPVDIFYVNYNVQDPKHDNIALLVPISLSTLKLVLYEDDFYYLYATRNRWGGKEQLEAYCIWHGGQRTPIHKDFPFSHATILSIQTDVIPKFLEQI